MRERGSEREREGRRPQETDQSPQLSKLSSWEVRPFAIQNNCNANTLRSMLHVSEDN